MSYTAKDVTRDTREYVASFLADLMDQVRNGHVLSFDIKWGGQGMVILNERMFKYPLLKEDEG